jgi:uncharacterized protein YbjT (DUF2867 family)
MILVVGATGTSGREVVDRLAAAGVPVRALVRDPGKAGDLRGPNVEPAAGDLDDPGSLVAAMAGVERVFLVTAVDRRHDSWVGNLLDAARRAGARHVVKLSVLGSDPDGPAEILRQHGRTDRMLADSGLAHTILRPNAFHQNVILSAATIKDHGAFYLPLRDVRQSLVDVRDIAAVAVAALTGPGHEGETYEITGPRAISYHDVAAALSAALGKPVRYVDVPPEAALDAMLKAGMPEWNARAVAELYGVFGCDVFATTTDVVERVTGRPPIPFEQFARDHAAAFA